MRCVIMAQGRRLDIDRFVNEITKEEKDWPTYGGSKAFNHVRDSGSETFQGAAAYLAWELRMAFNFVDRDTLPADLELSSESSNIAITLDQVLSARRSMVEEVGRLLSNSGSSSL